MRKRRDNSGRILKSGETQRKDKTYMFRWTNPNGKRDCFYARTLEELREKEAEVQREVSVGVSRTSITLNEQIEIYLQAKGTLAKSTMANYKSYYNRYIKPSRMGRTKLADLKKSQIRIFYNELHENGLSAGTIKIVHKIIHPALQLACDDNLIVKNPSDGCTKEYAENMEKKYGLTLDEEKEFLDRLLVNKQLRKYYPMCAILLQTGMRISEAVGLTWDDVDMKGKQININHQVQYRKIDEGAKYFATETKTSAGKRIIPMTDEIYQLFI